MSRPKPMTEAEWYALGNPPGSFDDVLEMARENEARLLLGPPKKLAPHVWDEWGRNKRQTTVDEEPPE